MSRASHRVRVAVALAIALAIPPAGGVAAACWSPPVSAPVRDPFREPACRWCPGNRGLEYATVAGAPVTAIAPGRVTFSGAVAGTEYLVVDVGAGRRVTYGRLLDRRVALGDRVVRGQRLGRADAAFHLGVRVGDRYVDPAPLIGRLVGRPRLVPADDTPAAPSPAPRLRCAGGPSHGPSGPPVAIGIQRR